LLVSPGDSAGFVQAVCAAAAGRVDVAGLRQQARQAALRNDWEPVLQGFEQRLRALALSIDVLHHASLA